MSAPLDLPKDLVAKVRTAAALRRLSPDAVIEAALNALTAGDIVMTPVSGQIADRAIAHFETSARALSVLVTQLRSETPDADLVLGLLGCAEVNLMAGADGLAVAIRGAGECVGTA